MKKNLAVGFILACTVAAIFWLNRTPPERQGGQTPAHVEKIDLFHYFSGPLSGGLAEMVAIVNRQSEDRQVVTHPLDHEAFKSMIHTTIDRGHPPELFTYWAGAKTQTLVDQGKLMALDDIWKTSSLASRFDTPVTEAASTYNGYKYLLPITQHFVVFFYRTDIFAELELKPPHTWTEMIAAATRIKEAGITPFSLGARERWPAQFWFDYLLLRTAGAEYRQRLMAGLAGYLDPEVQKAYKMWGQLLLDGFFNDNANQLDWAEASRKLCSGEAAMTLMGTWAIQLLTAEQCGLPEISGFDFFAFPVIDPAIPVSAVGPVDGLVLTAASSNHDFAKEVLVYFSQVEPQQKLSQGSGAFAPSSKIPDQFYSPLRLRILQESRKAQYWAFNYDLATPSTIADKGMDSFNELIAYPDQSNEILKNLEAETRPLWRQQRGE